MPTADELYKRFNDFEPDVDYETPILWPDAADLSLLGYGVGISYRSDKWTGDVCDYIHAHTTPVVVLVPSLPGYPPSPPPPPAPQGAKFALLGKDAFFCLDVIYLDALTGKIETLDFFTYPILPWIAAHTDGHTLVITYPGTIPLLVTGPGLQVTELGIVG